MSCLLGVRELAIYECGVRKLGVHELWRMSHRPLEHDPEKPAPDLIRGVNRFSETSSCTMK
jgi:hypothetical protein